ncbi:hypothetical protein FMM05_20835, partial [Flavobacterium zepuense]
MKNLLYILLLSPLFSLAQTSTQNYVKTTTYRDETTTSNPSLGQISISYMDGLGRPIQQVAHKASPTGKNIITHIEYDAYNRQPKEYMPFASTSPTVNMGFHPQAKDSTMLYYNTTQFEMTTNPYTEQFYEASPLNRVFEQGAPGTDWKINTSSDLDHTIKFDYQTNKDSEVRKFAVNFTGGDTEKTELACVGHYAENNLYKSIVKNENWKPSDGKSNTTEEFKDKEGHMVLKRTYTRDITLNLDIPHDTYYVYDIFNNLTYVIPPLAADDIVQEIILINSNGRNYPWTSLGRVSQQLADDYQRAIDDYENSEILNADLLSAYGGQGGFTLLPDENGNLVLNINITTTNPMPYRTGIIADLRELGTFTDRDLGRIQGAGYSYYFLLRGNQLEVTGSGDVPSVNTSFNSGTPLEYSQNHAWTKLCRADAQVARDYDTAISTLNNSEILTTYTANTYGAFGGAAISVDDDNTVSLSLNITSTTPLQFLTGAVLPLSIQRKLPDMVLDSISGSGYNYVFKIINNNLHISGSGTFTNMLVNSVRYQNVSY